MTTTTSFNTSKTTIFRLNYETTPSEVVDNLCMGGILGPITLMHFLLIVTDPEVCTVLEREDMMGVEFLTVELNHTTEGLKNDHAFAPYYQHGSELVIGIGYEESLTPTMKLCTFDKVGGKHLSHFESLDNLFIADIINHPIVIKDGLFFVSPSKCTAPHMSVYMILLCIINGLTEKYSHRLKNFSERNIIRRKLNEPPCA